jgi:hypothetical protein
MIMEIRKLLEKNAEMNGKSPFLYFRDQIINFSTLDQNVNRAAHLLRG